MQQPPERRPWYCFSEPREPISAPGPRVLYLPQSTIRSTKRLRRCRSSCFRTPPIPTSAARTASPHFNQFARVAHFSFDQVKKLHQEHPALLNTRATWDESAIEAASHMGLTEMAQWLADQGACISTCTAVLLGLTDRVREAVTLDPKSVYERGAHDIAILAYTAYGREKAEMAEILLKAGASVHGKALNLTTLHLAASKGQMDLATVLLDHGADVNAAVKARGKIVTPLDLAIQAKQSKMEQ